MDLVAQQDLLAVQRQQWKEHHSIQSCQQEIGLEHPPFVNFILSLQSCRSRRSFWKISLQFFRSKDRLYQCYIWGVGCNLDVTLIQYFISPRLILIIRDWRASAIINALPWANKIRCSFLHPSYRLHPVAGHKYALELIARILGKLPFGMEAPIGAAVYRSKNHKQVDGRWHYIQYFIWPRLMLIIRDADERQQLLIHYLGQIKYWM